MRRTDTPHPPLGRDQRKKLAASCRKHGLERVASDLARAARPRLELRAGKVHTGRPRPGRSRLGGAPDLPPGTPWPTIEDQPLLFMAQLRMDELPIPRGWPLPRRGLLSFFKGDDENRCAVDHVVVHSRSTSKLERLAPPALPYDYHEHLASCPVRAGLGITLPAYGEADWDALELDDVEDESYFPLRKSLCFGRSGSLLGHDDDVDELPTERLAIDEMGGPNYDYEWKQKNIAAIRARAARWVPLFQMDSIFDIGLCMWDAYTFVVLIRWDDLRARRFDRTRAHLARC